MFFVLFFSFSHWNHVIFGLQLVSSSLVHMCTVVALEKIKSRVCQGVSGGYKNTILSHFCLFFGIFCLFLQFSTLESCYIWFTLVQSNIVHMCTVVALEKFKIWICQGVPGGTKTPFLAIFAYFLRIFGFFFSFLHWNHVIFDLYQFGVF